MTIFGTPKYLKIVNTISNKIDYISKTKSRTKKTHKQKIIVRSILIFPVNLATFEQFFYVAEWLHLWRPITKNRKNRFRILRIFNVKMDTSKGGGLHKHLYDRALILDRLKNKSYNFFTNIFRSIQHPSIWRVHAIFFLSFFSRQLNLENCLPPGKEVSRGQGGSVKEWNLVSEGSGPNIKCCPSIIETMI